ncbi:MAG: SpoIID/LytB domain-containing protein, partial [Lachnospirales bacterium]
LKVLSIIYRTTAINYIKENELKSIGANLDDSSKYQIYNNKQSDEIFKQAVEQTKGIILTSEGSVIKPTYFSHSPGVTGNSGEIWANRDYYSYPTENKPYLLHIKDFEDNIYENLQEEVNSNIFYKTKDINSIEKDSKWFRWSTTLEESDILKISDNIKEIYKDEKYLIKTLDNNNYIYKPVDNVGKIKDINVKKRGEAGNIMELEIVGDNNTVLLMSDLIIKKVITLKSVIDNNGEIVQNVNSVPSTYFVFDKIYDNNGYLKKITLYGGGYGHCVGLSLYGANQMVKNGKTYEEILSRYYKNIDIVNIY